MALLRRAAPFCALLCARCEGHAHITWPPARNGGNLADAGRCYDQVCAWGSQPAFIPGAPTMNARQARTYNVDVVGGPRDWTRDRPWRAPGTAPVYGSGCGTAGLGPRNLHNGGFPPRGVAQGADMLAALPPLPNVTTLWRRGATEEVAFAVTASHGGGYSWRLCRKGDDVGEPCFARRVLRFAGARQWLQYGAQWQYTAPLGTAGATGRRTPLARVEIPAVRVSEGTYPSGSEWTRNPIPGCALCDHADCFGGDYTPHLHPAPGTDEWLVLEKCTQSCSGINLTACPIGPDRVPMTQFPEPAPGVSGYTNWYPSTPVRADTGNPPLSFPFSIVDKVLVPDDVEPGEYLLSWRWDCEETDQVFQNCADVTVV